MTDALQMAERHNARVASGDWPAHHNGPKRRLLVDGAAIHAARRGDFMVEVDGRLEVSTPIEWMIHSAWLKQRAADVAAGREPCCGEWKQEGYFGSCSKLCRPREGKCPLAHRNERIGGWYVSLLAELDEICKGEGIVNADR